MDSDGANMKARVVLVSLLLAINTATCTIDVQKLKESASPLIQTFHDTASNKFQTITDKASNKLQKITEQASSKLQNLSEKASSTIHQLSSNAHENLQDFFKTFTLENLKKLDVLSVIPDVHKKASFKDTGKKIKFVKVFKEKDFLHEENIYPWPVVRRKVEYIYE